MADPAPIPNGTKTHLQSLFDKLYSSYSRDPMPVPAIQWSVNSGSAYLKVSGVTATLVMTSGASKQLAKDTFIRPDQSGLGTASDGHIWTTLALLGSTQDIISNTAVVTNPSDNLTDVISIGDSLSSSNYDVYVKWKSQVIIDDVNIIVSWIDNSNYVYVTVELSGFNQVTNQFTGEQGVGALWAGASLGDWVWTHVHVENQTVQYRSWVDGNTEPTSWDNEYTFTLGTPLGTGFVALQTYIGDFSLPLEYGEFFVNYQSIVLSRQADFNLVNDGLGNKPTLDDFRIWLNERLLSFFVSDFTVGWYPGYTDTSLAALVLAEGYTNSGFPIPTATAPNYLQLRVMSLVFDLISSDTENFFTHLSVAGLDNHATDPKIGIWLDWVGGFYGIKRFIRLGTIESNESYRRRILRMLSQPRENNTAIANIVGQSVGVWDILVVDYRLFWALLIVFGSLPDPTIPLPLAKSVAPAGVRWTGIDIPGTTGDIGGAIAGRVRAGNTGLPDTARNPFHKREGWTASNYSDYWDDSIAIPLNGTFVVLS